MKEIYEERRQRLLALKESLGRGAIARIAEVIDIEANYISRALYPEGKKGKKNIGDEMVVKLDAKFPQWKKATAGQPQALGVAEPTVPGYGPSIEELSQEERQLIMEFRKLPKDRQAALLMTARYESDLNARVTKLRSSETSSGPAPART